MILMKKQTVLSLMAALALCWALTGCGGSAPEDATPADQADNAAPAVETVEQAQVPATEEIVLQVEEDADVVPSTVLAIVNGKELTDADLEETLAMFMKQMGGRVPPEQLQQALPQIRERIMEELIMRQIMTDEVAKQGISLSDDEFAEIQAELTQELPPGTTIEDYMTETGTTEAEMREQMAVRKMIIAQAESLAKPTDEEIQAFYAENKDGFSQGDSVTASHILLKVDPSDTDEAKAAKKARIEALQAELQGGADFAQLATENSDCPSASSGGDLGSFGRGQMVPEFEDAAFSQAVGTVGDVVETQFGYHLIKVSENTSAETLGFDEVKERITDMLYSQAQQDAVREYVDGLRENAEIKRLDTPPADASMLELEEEIVEEVAVEEAPKAVEESMEAATPAPEATATETAIVALETPSPIEPPTAEPVTEAVSTPATLDELADQMDQSPDMVEVTKDAIEKEAGQAVEEVKAVAKEVKKVIEKPDAEGPGAIQAD
jgi:peptidyl-prolyl cis-trans isomerase C